MKYVCMNSAIWFELAFPPYFRVLIFKELVWVVFNFLCCVKSYTLRILYYCTRQRDARGQWFYYRFNEFAFTGVCFVWTPRIFRTVTLPYFSSPMKVGPRC